ncbi:MAG TPA: DMT family transporter [Gemmatimonadales bacterium]|jgi:Permeases of the drug/metabolite transporter (DMT) superfamily
MPVILALLVVQIIYASGVIVGKFMLPIVPASVIVTMRMIVATGAFFTAHRIIGGKAPRNTEDWVKFALLGILGGAGNQFLILLGLTRTTAINAAILIPMIPIFTVIFGWLLKRDRPSPLKWLGVAVAALGTVYLIGPDRVSLESGVALGNLLVLAGMAFNALAFLLSKEMLERYAPVTVAFCLTVAGLIGILPFGLGAVESVNQGALTPRLWLWLAYMVVFPTTVTYFLNLWSLRRASPTLVTSFIYLQPLFTTAVAPLVLEGEELTTRIALSGAAIFLGVGVVIYAEWRRRKSTA